MVINSREGEFGGYKVCGTLYQLESGGTVWKTVLRSLSTNEPPDHLLVEGQTFKRLTGAEDLNTGIVQTSGQIQIDPAKKEAILAAIRTWESDLER